MFLKGALSSISTHVLMIAFTSSTQQPPLDAVSALAALDVMSRMTSILAAIVRVQVALAGVGKDGEAGAGAGSIAKVQSVSISVILHGGSGGTYAKRRQMAPWSGPAEPMWPS